MKGKCSQKLSYSSALVRFSFATMVAVFPSKVFAQNLNCFNNLIFGEIITCGAAGTVTNRPDNTQASTCVTVGGPISAGRCVATQSFPFRPIQISLTAAKVTITGGGSSMSVTSFNIITNANGPTATITAPFVNIPIGATLNVGGSQAAGTYTGSMGVTAILQ